MNLKTVPQSRLPINASTTTGIGQKQNPRKPQKYAFRRLFFAIATHMAQNTMLTTILATRKPIGLFELHDDGVYRQAVTGC